jgi:hypothetical protein
MTKILESLDESVFTDELKAELQESFTASVNEEVEKQLLVQVAEQVSEKVDARVAELDEKFEDFKDEYKSTLLENMDEFLDLIAQEYVAENKITIEESVEGEKLEALMEGFNSMLVTAGVELKEISEGTQDVVEAKELTNARAKVDELVAENKDLKKAKAELLEMGLVAELKEGMTEVQKEKFDKLTSVVDFSLDESDKYMEKLLIIKESVVATKKVEDNVDESADKKVEDVVVEGSVLSEDYADSKRFF